MKELTVIKFGGSIAKDAKIRKRFLADLAKFSRHNPVALVHGGGPEINAWITRLGLTTKFVNGLRFTDKETLEIAGMVLNGKVNKEIVLELNKLGVKAAGISGIDGKLIRCLRLPRLGYVGEPEETDTSIISILIANKFLPVISSTGYDKKGSMLNINADSLAMAIAQGLKAQRLILLTDVAGVLDKEKKTIPVIRLREIRGLLDNNVISGGMIPKIEACRRAVKAGVKEVWIIDGAKGLEEMKGTVVKL